MSTIDQLYALLFVSDSPSSASEFAVALDLPEGTVIQALELLEEKLKEGPLSLAKIAKGYQLSTKPEYSDVIAKYLRPQKQRMSRSVLEVLAIIAYKQPVTTSDIEDVRGVQSDYGIRILAERNLIFEVGRKQTPGRPVLWGTTPLFLHAFNLHDLDQLPGINLEGMPQLPELTNDSELEFSEAEIVTEGTVTE